MSAQPAVVPLKVNLEQLGRCLALCSAANLTAAVWGTTGAGKSAVIKETIAKLDRVLFDFRVSTAEPTDLGGNPWPVVPTDTEGKPLLEDAYLRYIMANNLMPFKTKVRPNLRCALFLDEADRTDNPNMKNAMLQLIYDKSINGMELVDDCWVVVAGNATTDVDTSTLNAAQAGRMVHFYVETEGTAAQESWDRWADENDIADVTRGFMREKWNLVSQLPKDAKMPEELGRPTPRTVEFADRLIAVAESPEVPFNVKDIITQLIQGCIGRAAATEYLEFRRLFLSAPTSAEILADPEHVRIPSKTVNGQEAADPGILYSLTLSLCDQASKDRAVAEAVATYGLRWPEEPAAFLFRRLLDKYPQIATSQSFQKWNSKRMRTQPSVVTASSDNYLPILVKTYLHSKPLPENDGWINRIQIPSESDPSRHYIIAQERKGKTWACSCRAWTTRRTCKHLDKLPLS